MASSGESNWSHSGWLLGPLRNGLTTGGFIECIGGYLLSGTHESLTWVTAGRPFLRMETGHC